MLQHFNQFSYFYALGIITLTTLILNLTKGRIWIIKHQNKIAYLFALMQFILYIYTTFFHWFKNMTWFAVLLHDLCPALSFFSIIAFIWNKEKVYKAIMPWLIIGSLVTMVTSEAPILTDPIWLTSYLEHSIMLIQGILTYFWVSKYSKSELLKILIFPSILMIWILFSALLPWQLSGNERWADSATGLLPPSVAPDKTFGILSQITWAPYPLSTILFYGVAVLVALLIALNKKYQPFYKSKIVRWKETYTEALKEK